MTAGLNFDKIGEGLLSFVVDNLAVVDHEPAEEQQGYLAAIRVGQLPVELWASIRLPPP